MSRPLGDLAGVTVTVRVPGPAPDPDEMGATISPPEYWLNVTVNSDADGVPREVFASYAPPGIVGTHALLNAMCRLASRLLQADVPLAETVKMMRGQADGWNPVRWGPGADMVVASAADAVGRVLEAANVRA